MMNAIGGTSIHYWAQSWRLKPWDFRTRSESIRRYGPNSIPAGSTLEDWPLTYDELEPYYDIIEQEVGVSGKAGNIQGRIDPAGNVFEGPRQREYPMPPLRGAGFTDHMLDAARQLGWKPFRPPAAINSQPYRGRAQCVFHGYCSAGGCHVGAKNSTAITTIPRRRPHQKPDHLRQRPSHAHRLRFQRPRHRRHLHPRSQRVFSAGQDRAGGGLHLRKLANAAALEIEGVSQRAFEQSRPGGAALFRTLDTATSARCSPTTSTSGTGCPRRA